LEPAVAELISQSLYEEIRDLLLEPSLGLDSRSRRESLLVDAFRFRNGSLYTSINKEGDISYFVSQLLNTFANYGCFEGRHPVSYFLEAFLKTEGIDMKERIDNIIKKVDSSCSQTIPTGDVGQETGNRENLRVIGGEYLLLEDGLIRSGDHWEIWKAKQLGHSIGRCVAIKLLRRDLPDRTKVSLSREIEHIARLEHPHIVPVYGWDKEKMSFLVIRLLSGGSLRDRMKQPMTPQRVLDYTVQLAEALQYAHNLGVFHGNMMPENILFDDKIDHPYLSDFGLTYQAGTPLAPLHKYIAPEQLNGLLTANTDQYALSLIVYEMLTGILPDVVGKTRRLRPVPGYLSDACFNVLNRACDHHPQHRFPNVIAFTDALKTAIQFGKEPSNRRDEEQAYLDILTRECEQRIKGYVNLPGVKQHLIATSSARSSQTGAGKVFIRHAMLYEARRSFMENPEAPTEDVRDTIIGLKRTVLLGEPGSGKTTTLLQIALECTLNAQTDPGAPIPVFVPLNAFNGDIPFETFVRNQMPGIGHQLELYLNESGRLFFIFDALNETLQTMKSEVVEYLSHLPRFVVSCRTRDYNQELVDLEELSSVKILDLDPVRIRRALYLRIGEQGNALWQEIGGNELLLEFWKALEEHGQQKHFWYLDKAPSYTRREADQAWFNMHGLGILPLCKNPFMLAMVCDLYQHQGRVPANRGELFERFVDECIGSEILRIANVEAWQDNDTRYLKYKESVLLILSELAQEIQSKGLGAGIEKNQAMDLLRNQWQEAEINLALGLSSDAGIITMDTNEILYSHQLIQEYFASEILGRAIDSDPQVPATEFFPPQNWWEPQGWEETAIILAGVRGRNGLTKVVKWIAEAQPELAIRCILESGLPGVTLDSIEPSLRKWLQVLWQKQFLNFDQPLQARAIIGQSIAKIRDPRKGVCTIIVNRQSTPDIAWCNVPGKSYKLSHYPVTNSQYNCFIEAEDGYNRKQWWGFSEEAEMWHQRNPLTANIEFNDSNCPRVEVSWFEAAAFCYWLSHRMGQGIRLPKIAEWEWAAYGPGESCYPWGNQYTPHYCNVENEESQKNKPLKRTSSVGMFPQSESYCGAQDMIGNVWEWCSDFCCQRHCSQDESHGTPLTVRVLKGSSWSYRLEFARRGYKFWTFPGNRKNDAGFRVLQPFNI
jgi:serine/threonine protein kinase